MNYLLFQGMMGMKNVMYMHFSIDCLQTDHFVKPILLTIKESVVKKGSSIKEEISER